MVMTGPTVFRLMLIVLATMSLAGCELVGGIFKAGVYTGIFIVVVLIALVAFGVMKMKR
jgi:hypothetical protein